MSEEVYRIGRPALGHICNLLIAILASILSGFVIYANKLLPTTLINKLEFDAIKQQLSYSYFATYQHMGPYCLGILTGYLIHKTPNAHLPKYLTWMLWLLLPPLSFTTLLLTYLWNGAYDEPAMINPSPLVSAFYVAIHRTIWTALVAWLVFACATGRAKMISQFLSHSIFIPISRLSYSIYLVHLPVIMFRALNLKHTVEWSDQNILWEACGNFVASMFMGYFLNVTFESPIINIENYVSGRDKLARNLIFAGQNIKLNSNGHSDGDSGSGGDTSSSHDTEPTSTPEQERKSLSSNDALASSSKATHLTDKPVLLNQTSRRRSLRPNQNSVDSIFGVRSDVSNNSSQHERETSACVSKTDERAEIEFAASEAVETEEALPRQERMRLQRARRRFNEDQQLFGSMRTGNDVYNITGEYRHYAPAGYQQWRLLNQNGTRRVQYATLARTDRRSAYDRPDTFMNGGKLYMESDYLRSQSSYRHLHEFPLGNAPHRGADRYIVHNSAASFRLSKCVKSDQPRYIPGSPNENSMVACQGLNQHLATSTEMVSRRRQGRYNTLTGTGSHDSRSRYLSSEGAKGLDMGKWAHDNWFQLKADLEGAPRKQQEESPITSWLHQGTMIPRIDSSTLRRQKRSQADAMTSSSIVEESPDQMGDSTGPENNDASAL